jgi:hypothetical protein
MYIEILDGLRSHYEKRLKNSGSAGYQAAMSMSFLFGVCAAAIFIIIDVFLSQNLHGLMWAYDHKLLVVAFGVVTAWAHVQYAKTKLVYNKSGPPISSLWRPWFVGYCFAAALLSVFALWLVYQARVPD